MNKSLKLMYSIRFLFLNGFLAFMLMGCAKPADPQNMPFSEEAEVRRTVLAHIKNMKTEDFRNAFLKATNRPHQAEVEVRALDEAGNEIGRDVRTHLQTPKQPVKVLTSNQKGIFKDMAEQPPLAPDTSFAELFLPDENTLRSTPYLEKYLLRRLDDRVLPFGTVQVFEMAANPRSRTTPEITQIRYFVTAKDQKLVGVETKRTVNNLLFAEQSYGTLYLQPVADVWLPVHAQFTLFSKTLFLSPQNLSIRYRYGFAG